MTDRLTPEQRRRCMQGNRGTGTLPEKMLANELWRRGYRYRKNVRNVPGKPDICFRKQKVAVFVDGEFWHGRDWQTAQLRIQSRRDYWWPKIENNIRRDSQVNARLMGMGWKVLRFWDSEVRKHVASCADKVEEALRESTLLHLHRVYDYDTQYDDLVIDQVAEPDLMYDN